MLRRRPFRRSRSPFTWRAVAFEVVTIVIGVLIALGVNEARERYRAQQRADVVAELLHAEFEDNCRAFRRAVDYHRPMIAELDSVLAFDPLAGTPDRIPSGTNGLSPVYPSTSAYDAAQATGDLSLLGLRAVLGLGKVRSLNALYQDAVDRAIDALAGAGEGVLARMRMPFRILYELEQGAAGANCQAYAELSAGRNVPVDSALVRGLLPPPQL